MGALRALLALPLAASGAMVLRHHSEPGAGGSSLPYCVDVLSGDLVALSNGSETFPSTESASRVVEASCTPQPSMVTLLLLCKGSWLIRWLELQKKQQRFSTLSSVSVW